jgi:hypothetical protein
MQTEVHKTPSQPMAGHVTPVIQSSSMGNVVQAGLDIKQDSVSKISNPQRADGVTQVVKHLLSKHKALNVTPSTNTQNKKGIYLSGDER